MFQSTIVLAAVAAVAVTVSGYATAPNYCSNLELAKFVPLLTTNGANLTECQAASGWTFIPPSAEPTIDQEIKMCNNAGCKALLDAVKAKNPSDCFLSLFSIPTQGVNVKKLVDEFEPFCEVFGNSTISA